MAPPRELTQVTSTLWDDPSTAHQRQQELAAERAEALTELAKCDLTTVTGWETARALTKPQDGPLRFDVVADQAAAASPTRLAAVLAAFLAHPGFSLWEYKVIVERFTRLPLLPQAARAQLRYLATQVTTRFCIELTTRSHDYFDLPDLADTVGLNRDLQRDALNHLGSLPVPLTADQCFELATRLASRLTTDSARVALDDLSALLIQLAPDDFADGRYDALPPPPTTRAECVAGYLWAALADPATDTRWRAAHTVRLLIGLGCSEELHTLNRLASGTLDPAPFVDAQLPFYDKHALLWLLLALARAAHDPTPATELEMFIPLLERVAFVDPPHVLLRAVAASALLGLAKAGVAAVTVEASERARRVNTPTAVLSIPRRTRRTAKRPASLQREGTDTDVVDETDESDEVDGDDAVGEIDEADDPESDDIVRFFWDFTDHWCDDVADAFGLSNEDVARMVSQVVTDRWRFTHDDGHIDDPRHTRGLYQGHKTQTYKSSWPEVEDLDFYLATHALWTVAGTLIDSCPVYRDPSEDVDEFTQWLRRLLPTRDDGRWLADRRDPSPPSMFTSQYASVDADWMWRLNRSHFTERLLDGDWITVWEHSSDTGRRARQDVTVRSALVSPDRARALLLALQTAPSCMIWCLPHSPDDNDDNDDFKVPGFELTGWISTDSPLRNLDDRDPLAASVDYPPPRPDTRTSQLLDLVPDADMRAWTHGDARPAFRSRVWQDLTAPRDGRQSGCRGEQLQIHHDTLTELLAATANNLIVMVTIERTHDEHRHPYRHPGNEDDLPFLEPSFKVYLIDESGRSHHL